MFCGIGLTNAQLFELSVQEYKRNRVSQWLITNQTDYIVCLHYKQLGTSLKQFIKLISVSYILHDELQLCYHMDQTKRNLSFVTKCRLTFFSCY